MRGRCKAMETNLEALKERARRGKSFSFVFFWGHRASSRGEPGESCFSQWFPAPFEVDGVRYASAEHWMMAEKARLFGDHEALDRILSSASPGAAKALGAQVRKFDETRWQAHRFEIV